MLFGSFVRSVTELPRIYDIVYMFIDDSEYASFKNLCRSAKQVYGTVTFRTVFRLTWFQYRDYTRCLPFNRSDTLVTSVIKDGRQNVVDLCAGVL